MNIKPIKTEKDLDSALKRIERLWNAKPNSKEADELEILSVLVEAYENEHYMILPPDPVEAIKFRMEQQGLKRSDVAPILGGANRVTEVLNRTRRLTVKMIKALHEQLDIPFESLIMTETK